MSTPSCPCPLTEILTTSGATACATACNDVLVMSDALRHRFARENTLYVPAMIPSFDPSKSPLLPRNFTDS